MNSSGHMPDRVAEDREHLVLSDQFGANGNRLADSGWKDVLSAVRRSHVCQYMERD